MTTLPYDGAPKPRFPENAVAIVKSNSTVFASPLTVYVGTTGDVAIMPAGGTVAVTFKAVPAGGIVPCLASQVMSTNTTASDMVGIN